MRASNHKSKATKNSSHLASDLALFLTHIIKFHFLFLFLYYYYSKFPSPSSLMLHFSITWKALRETESIPKCPPNWTKLRTSIIFVYLVSTFFFFFLGFQLHPSTFELLDPSFFFFSFFQFRLLYNKLSNWGVIFCPYNNNILLHFVHISEHNFLMI